MTDERKPGGFLPPRSRPARDTGEELVDLRAQVEVLIASVSTRLNEGAAALTRLGKGVDDATATAAAANLAAVAANARPFPWKIVTPFLVIGLSALVALVSALSQVPTRDEIARAQEGAQAQLRQVESDVSRIRTELVRGAAAVEAIQREQVEQGLRDGRLEQKMDALVGRRR